MAATPPACSAAQFSETLAVRFSAARDYRVDTLRGLLLVIMTIDHVAPPWITRYSSETLGFVSAMEGFFILAGYAYVLAYRRYLDQPGMLWRKSLRRGLVIYGYHLSALATAFGVALLGVGDDGAWAERAADARAFGWALIGWAAVLIYRPQYFDVLPVYVLLLLLAPALLQGLNRSVSAIWLALGSVLVWLLGQYWDPLSALAIAVSPIPAVWPNLLTWQLLFVLGMCLAVLPPQSALAEWSRRRGVVAASFGLAVLCFAARHHVLELPPAILALFSKANLAPLRVFNVLLLVQLGARLMAWVPLQARVAWLALLGRHSLEVFSFHILLAYAVPPLFGAPALSDSGLVLLTAACTLALLLPAGAREWAEHAGRTPAGV